MDRNTVQTWLRLALRLGGIAVVVGGVLVLGLLGWQWQATSTVDRITVTGARYASPDTLRHLARVDSGMVMRDVDAPLVSDRLMRHPWVETARVVKQRATRTLELAVTERTPAALAIDGRGRPAFYLDAAGYGMPVPDSTAFDVPLVRGLAADYHPMQRLAPGSVRQVLTTLQRSAAAPLVAEVHVHPDSTVSLLTEPVGGYGAVPVRVGRGQGLSEKLDRLRAFARTILATQPDLPIGEIDLRFADQIVTRPSPLDG